MVEALLQRGAVEHVHDAGRLRCCRGGRSGGSAGASTTPSTAARRCSASPASPSSATAGRRAKAVRNAVAMAYRFAADRLHRARSSGTSPPLTVTAPVIAFIFPGQGSQKVGMGQALAEAFPDLPRDVRRGRRGARRAAEPALLRRSRGSADADREHAAGDPRGEHRRVPAARVARASTPAFVAGHSLGEYSAQRGRRHASRSPTRCGIVRRRGRYMQEAVPVGDGAMAAILGLDADARRAGVRRGGGGRGRQPREPERRRTGRDRRRARRGRARRRARQGARRQARRFRCR